MPVATISLSEQAFNYAHRKKEGRSRGIGRFISECLAQAEARELALEQVRQALADPPVRPSKQSWKASGVRVD
jgi:hypothetical protein